MRLAWAVVLSYLLGSVSCAGLAGIAARRDPRGWGSGRLGAWNVARRLGLAAGLLVFSGDFAKGAAAPLLAGRFLPAPLAPQAAALAVVLGHVWPLWFGFRGGKGLAAALGVLAALDLHWLIPPLAAAALALALTRDIHRGALAGIAVFPPYLHLAGAAARDLFFGWTLAAILLFTHRDNLREILPGLSRTTTPP